MLNTGGSEEIINTESSGKNFLVKHLEEQVEKLTSELKDYRQLEDQLAQAQKRETLASLSGGIAHDFNNILHCILGYTELALLNKKDESANFEILQQIQSIVNKGRDLAQRFLLFGRKSNHCRVQMNLNEIVKEVECLLLRTMPRMIEIEHTLDESLYLVNGDTGQCEQVVMNLCINAMDAMPHGGRLLLKTENISFSRDNSAQIDPSFPPGRYVRLSVSDTGRGMTADIAKHIFEPFFTTKEKGQGTGLGLSMVYSIVKSHGGYLDCRSTPDSGSTFQIYFPALNIVNTQHTVIKERPFMSNSGGGELILFVEDEEAILAIGKRFLEDYGYTVLTTQSCEEGLDLYNTHPVNLVIMDVGMPGMGGVGLLKSLQSVNADVKVLIISGYPANSDTITSLNLDTKAFLPKPFTSEKLLQTVRIILDHNVKPVERIS